MGAGLDVMTDTYHDDLEMALSQAAYEYEGLSEAWIEVSAP